MIPLNLVLSAERTFIGDFGASKKKVIQTLAEKLASVIPAISELDLFDQIIARERLGSTGIGSGVAVPHCRIANLEEPVAALVRLTSTVDYDAVDKKPVDLVFALIVPEQATDDHLQLLAAAVERFHNSDTLQQLRRCETASELYQTFVAEQF